MVQKVLGWGAVAIAVIAAFVDIPMVALILLVIGLVSGFANPIEDVATRVAYYVLAAALPTISNRLDVIPAVGSLLNAIMDTFSITLAGIALANVVVSVYNNLMEAGNG